VSYFTVNKCMPTSFPESEQCIPPVLFTSLNMQLPAEDEIEVRLAYGYAYRSLMVDRALLSVSQVLHII